MDLLHSYCNAPTATSELFILNTVDSSSVYLSVLCVEMNCVISIVAIPVNRPESGGTVPIFAAMSRCPAKHFICP